MYGKLILFIIIYILIMNTVVVVGSFLIGGAYSFNMITGIIVPALCAIAAGQITSRRRNRNQGQIS